MMTQMTMAMATTTPMTTFNNALDGDVFDNDGSSDYC